MTQQQQFYRKIIYIVVIAILIIPLYVIGNPTQLKKDGGKLSRLRAESGFSEVYLGKIDPASSTMKLATFGMRGVAIALLWHRSLEFEKRADWDGVVLTGNQIVMLEPHFSSIWEFVGWKLAYNASAQFDDYRERYRRVIDGFEFLQNGTQYNQKDPKLFWKAGWTISQKIGIADEKSQYRRLFRNDDDFHNNQPYQERDNWLFGNNYYKESERLYEAGGSIGNETRIVFYSRPRLNLIHYAEWMEKDGCGFSQDNKPLFDEEHAATAWKNAQNAWEEFEKIEVTTVIEDKNNPGQYRKTSLDRFGLRNVEIEALIQKMEAMLPEGQNRETIVWDRWNNELNDKQRARIYPMVNTPPPLKNDGSFGEQFYSYNVIHDFLTGAHGPQPEWADWQERLSKANEDLIPENLREVARLPRILQEDDAVEKLTAAETVNNDLLAQAIAKLAMKPKLIAEAVKPEFRAEALDLCNEIEEFQREARFSKQFREIIDADYHKRRVVIEQQPEARLAREKRSQVRSLFEAAQHEEANQTFLESMGYWKQLMDKPGFEDFKGISQYGLHFTEEIEKYIIVLEQLERLFPEDYPLIDFVRNDQLVSLPYAKASQAMPFIQKKYEEGDYQNVINYAFKVMVYWDSQIRSSDVIALAPTPELKENIVSACRLWTDAWRKMGGASYEEAQRMGYFERYPTKNFIEMVVEKGEPLYQEIQQNDMQRLADTEQSMTYLEKSVDLWTKLVEKYPILLEDTRSSFFQDLQQTVQLYVSECRKIDRAIPEDWPLRRFID